MTRQRIRPSLKRSVFSDCPCCKGAGLVKTPESMAIEVVRLLIRVSQHTEIEQVMVTVAGDVADYLNNKKRHELVRLEGEGKLNVQVVAASGVAPEHLAVECLDGQGRQVKLPKT